MDKRSTFIIHMNIAAKPKPFSDNHSWFSATLRSITDSPKFIYSYTNVINGFSAVLSSDELHALRQSPGFLSAYADKQATLDTTHTSQFLSLNHDAGLWPASNYGEDIIIGVIDSGVWPESDSFNDKGMRDIPKKWKGKCESGAGFNSSVCNLKLIGAPYFNKGLMAATNSEISLFGDSATARDSMGHGTHTSSTAAGSEVTGASFHGYGGGIARGAMPRARLAIYKALWDNGRYASDVLAAMDQAITDGVDIISISMGFDGVPLHEDPIAIASFAAMEKGILVSASAGNSGPDLSTMHNGIPWVLTVAAGTVGRKFFATLTLGNGRDFSGGVSLYPAKALLLNVPLVYNKTFSSCNSSETLSAMAEDMIVLCDFTSSIDYQMRSVTQSNAAGAIFINDNLDAAKDFTCPSVIVSAKDGFELLNYVKEHKETATVTVSFQQTLVDVKPAPAVAEYSSRGPSPSFPGVLKPDIMAPGEKIIAAWVPTRSTAKLGRTPLASDFNIMSGTSMATPHVSGVAALLKSVHSEWSPSEIKSAILTTANTLDNTLEPIKELADRVPMVTASALAMGAGQVDPNKAMDPGLVYETGTEEYVSLLCASNYTSKQIMAITRWRSAAALNCSKASKDLNYPSFIAIFDDGDYVQRFVRTVTNVGYEGSVYKVKVVSPGGVDIRVKPETLVFKEKYEKLNYEVQIKRSRKRSEKKYSDGSIIWLDIKGKYKVRSPVVVVV
ncbi:hypothetical protein J5N97_019964 [Dioscorea zingiberensis]|uniref:Subtilisin-like protease SBT1.9 n=1 Tax=Dioscorea zingiberensis TaxID=325984 RepID=A0A9D5CFL0_9LILI|nr:hypothetical protein J5N97_019964 [Dioscorea zingiberensis]